MILSKNMKNMIVVGTLATGLAIQGAIISNYYRSVDLWDKEIHSQNMKSGKFIRDKREKEDLIFKEIAIKQYKKVKYEQEEIERMKNYTYRTIKELKQKTGLNVIGFEEYTFELSFYTDLNCENGYGNLTANGETLSHGMIANNFLPFNTNVYIEGFGLKRVTDRGSEKYFDEINKADVFVPRNSNESESEYLSRINNMGRKHVKTYILKIKE